MSETALPSTETKPADTPAAAKAPPPAKGGNTVAALALIVGLAALAAGGWSAWQFQQQKVIAQQHLGQLESNNAAARDQFKAIEGSVLKRMAGLPSAAELGEQRDLVMNLQSDQQRLAQNLSDVLSKSREDWRLAESEHLLRLATLRLSALQDVPSATALIEGADQILREQNDPQAFAARGELIKVIEGLRALPELDRSGLFLQLAALRGQVNGLQELVPEYILSPEQPTKASANDTSRWNELWDQLSRYVRLDLQADQDIRPQLAGQSLAQVRLTLGLAIEQAQWAALNGQPQVYRQALDAAQDVLRTYFDANNPSVQAMQARLGELAGHPVSVQLPSLDKALTTLRAYIKQRETAALEAPKAEQESGQ
ncbi:uroporphyrinogen-III C-methyltransferase [Pseudomonas sp. LRF_L74]|uniref:uroporphyrinogen-III C-methyltransferase n=1 Tax=Pseudomonas sp. LRF_L74 TaxID=3369422 RepID=UPI003F618751